MDEQYSNNEENVPGTDPGNLPKTRSGENVHIEGTDNLSVPGTDPSIKIHIPRDKLGVPGTDPGFRAIDSTNKPSEAVMD